ncbi:hypothetical protein ABF176_002430 [Flavobacterium psychrophilum]
MKISYHLKFHLLLVLFLLNTKIIFAQKFEEIKGTYSQGSRGGITIYEDGTFALYGYATLVFGVYKFENGDISFTPDIPKQAFSIIGRKNMKIETGANFTFTRKFDDNGPTFIKIDDRKFQHIFDENNNGGSPHYSLDFTRKPNIVSLGLQTQNHKHNFNTNTFILDNKYNEFLLFYYATISEQKPFVGKIITENGAKALVCIWGTFRKVEKEDKGDEEMLQFLNKYKKEIQKKKDVKEFYFNDQLKSVTGYNHLSEQENIFDINNYVFDENSNKYIHKDIYQKGKNYTDAIAEDYHDENIILKYHLIEPNDITNIDYSKIEIDKNPLFPIDAPKKSNKNELELPFEVEGEEIPVDSIIEPTYIEPIPMPEKPKKKRKK